MQALTVAYATLAVATVVLIVGTYYRGGTDAIRQNGREIGVLLLGAIVLVVVMTIVNSAFAK